jgi:hypothetical protein
LILDGLDAVLPDLQKLRAGLAATQQGAGSASIWSAAVVPQMGTVSVTQVGGPPSPGWSGVARRAIDAGLRSFYHRAWWLNDPGPWSLGYPLSLIESRTQLSLAALLGAATTFTADVLDVPDVQTDLVRRVLPAAAVTGRPLDTRAGATPTLWTARAADWRTALVINWDEGPVDRKVRLADLGLPTGAYHGYDVWAGTPRRVTDPLPVSLDAHDCLVLGLRPRADHPLVIGTTRHVVQGSVDLADEHWDAKAQTLSGRAVKLDGRPYGVTIAAAGWTPDELHADRPGRVRVVDSEYLVLEWPGGERGDLAWQLSLKRARRPRTR